jgi:hypothetical protein
MPVTQRETRVRRAAARPALAAAALLLAAVAGCESNKDASQPEAAAPPATGAASAPADAGSADQGGGQAGGDAAGRAPGECGFATAAEVRATMGVTAAAVDGTYTDATSGRCRFFTDPSKAKGGMIQLDVAGDRAGTWESAHGIYGKGRDVAGVGDKAYYDPDTGMLDILKGTTRVNILVGGDPSWISAGPAKAESIKLAKVVLPRVAGSES